MNKDAGWGKQEGVMENCPYRTESIECIMVFNPNFMFSWYMVFLCGLHGFSWYMHSKGKLSLFNYSDSAKDKNTRDKRFKHVA